MACHDIREFGALGDGETNDAPAIQEAIDACSAAGGGRVLVPSGGTYLCGPFDLKSNVEFHVERGARIIASTDREHYAGQEGGRRYFIGADGARNVAFTGGGVIDGRGPLFMAEETPYIFRKGEWRTFMLFLVGCEGLTFRDVTLRDGAAWTLRLSGCEDVVIEGIRILNNLKVPNNDAIDLDCCKNVRISDCHIESADDCICLKTCPPFAEQYGACENVIVRGCTLMSTSSALVIGCEAKAPMRNVIFDSCVIRSSHRGLSIHLSHEADVENVIFSNMIVETRIFHPKWWGRGEPIYLSAIPWTDGDTVGRIRRVRFRDILCRSENGVFIQGWEPDRIQDVLLENVHVEIDKWSKWPGGQHDVRPCPRDPGGAGPVGAGVYEHPTAGFFIGNARDVTLRNCRVSWGADRQDYWRHAVEAHGVSGLRLEGFEGAAAFPDRYDAISQD